MKYEIKNNYIKAQINSFGAELCSLKNSTKKEYIWQADEKYWKRHSPILFPIVGKLIDDEYTYKDKTYKLSQHGFARDMQFDLVEQKESFISFKLESNEDTLKVYPFDFTLFITYILEQNNLEVQYKVVNQTNGKIYFSIGAHPAFNWPLNSEKKQECFLEFKKKNSLEVYPITNKGISSNTKVLHLDNSKLNLSEKLFEDDALVLNDNIEELTFKNKTNTSYVKLTFKDFPYLGLWSKPTGSGFVCIEPWYGVADFIGHNKKIEEKKGIICLEENQDFDCSYTITI